MGCCMSKGGSNRRVSSSGSVSHKAGLNSYRAACKVDADLQLIDTRLQAKASQAITNLEMDVKAGSVSIDSLVGMTECFFGLYKEVINVIHQCKDDIQGNQELFKLVEDYFDNNSQTLLFFQEIVDSMKQAKDSQLLVLAALDQFMDLKSDMASEKCEMHVNVLEELKNFTAAGDPFKDYLQKFKAVYEQQNNMLQNLQQRRKKLDKKLKRVRVWKRLSSIIFLSAFAAVLISSLVVVSIVAPPLVAVLSSASSIPIGPVGQWMVLLWKRYENALNSLDAVFSSMEGCTKEAVKDLPCTDVAIKELEHIRSLIKILQVDITKMSNNAESEVDKVELRLKIADLRKQLETFMEKIVGLGTQADTCSFEMRKAKIAVLQQRAANAANIVKGCS